MRNKPHGRRRVENSEFCRNCDRLKHDEKLLALQEEVKTWRRELWLSHGCSHAALYGDDGEMQCGGCLLDFKRDPVEHLIKFAVRKKAYERKDLLKSHKELETTLDTALEECAGFISALEAIADTGYKSVKWSSHQECVDLLDELVDTAKKALGRDIE